MQSIVRKIIRIDEEKCDGCGECVPSCAEGAIAIVGGKARLVSETLCDGIGACLGRCPRGAITIEERAAVPFDPEAAERRGPPAAAALPAHGGPLAGLHAAAHGAGDGPGGCPGARFRELRPVAGAPAAAVVSPGSPAPAGPSRLSSWPVQLALVPPAGRMWQGADVLICADCVPFALAGFHERLLAGKSLAIACPKLDDVEPYVEKLAAIFGQNDIRSVTVAIMEVPCCRGLERVVEAAVGRGGRPDIPVRTIVVGVRGDLLAG